MNLIHFETLGCKLNQIETESIAAAFTQAGFTCKLKHETAEQKEQTEEIVPGPFFTPLIQPFFTILNTCTVTGKAEQKARRLIRLLLRKYPDSPILVTGCYAEVEQKTIADIDPRILVFPGSLKGKLAFLPQFLIDRESLHPGESTHDLLKAFIDQAESAQNQSSETFALSTDTFMAHSRASIKIQDGCNNACSYCRIRLARGKSVSLEAEEVIKRIKSIEEAGWKEVILTGVNLSQYHSNKKDFADLLDTILAETKNIAIRISSLYPERVNESLAPLLQSPRIRPHFHLSIQSGSDSILQSMHRPYKAETVYTACEILRKQKNNPFIACDIIAGYPGETDKDFEQTLKLCKDLQFAWIHAFPFSARPGTEAWNLKPRIPERVASERIQALTILAKQNHSLYKQTWLGKKVLAITEHEDKHNNITIVTENYIQAKLILLNEKNKLSIKPGSEVSVILGDNDRAFLA